jgi:hypothetical protein
LNVWARQYEGCRRENDGSRPSGHSGIARDDRNRLEEYRLRHKAVTFAEYAIGNLKRHLGETMAVDVTEKTVEASQTTRLKSTPKTINEEVGFLLRILGEGGDAVRAPATASKDVEVVRPVASWQDI